MNLLIKNSASLFEVQRNTESKNAKVVGTNTERIMLSSKCVVIIKNENLSKNKKWKGC